MPLLSLFSRPFCPCLFLFPPALCRVVLFAVVDTRNKEKRSIFWTNRISSLLPRPVLQHIYYYLLLAYRLIIRVRILAVPYSLLPDLLQVPLLCSHVPYTSTTIHHAFLSCRLIHTLHQPFFFHALPLRLSGALYATARSNQHLLLRPASSACRRPARVLL